MKKLYWLILVLIITSIAQAELKPESIATAEYALTQYQKASLDALAHMVSYKTVNHLDTPFDLNPEFIGFKRYLENLASELDMTFSDHGHVLLISIGTGEKVLGVITHGDVQPANPNKWQQSPFVLDITSDPEKLIGRGTEDDKGAIASAMFAMKAIQDQRIVLKGKIELLIYLAEESDWDPLHEFLKTYHPAPLNIALDAEYPVVTAEKAWSHVQVAFQPVLLEPIAGMPELKSFKGGSFQSQIPEDAIAEARDLSSAQQQKIETFLKNSPVSYQLSNIGRHSIITVKGQSAHSSKPDEGINAIAYLAAALGQITWQSSDAAGAVNYLSQLVGTGIFGEQFNNLAYHHEFMGPLTLSPTVAGKNKEGVQEVFINIRRPFGKSVEQVTADIHDALNSFKNRTKTALKVVSIYVGEPMWHQDAPQVPDLLRVFEHYTGIPDPKPIAIGGSTNAKLFPNGVSFGPSMPDTHYSGHSEHEFITRKHFDLTLKMVTAMMVEIAGQ